MTAEELEAWLDDPKSATAGTGVGIESGRKILKILKKNPTKDPEKYDDEDLEHIRKVVGYNKRHLAQEDHLKDTKTQEELENAKSTISLKNWGHDPLKTLDEEHGEEHSAGSASDGHLGHNECQIQAEGDENTPTEGGEAEVSGEEEVEPKQARKRKLGGEERVSDEEVSAEGKASPGCGDDPEVETVKKGGVSEEVEGDNGEDEPPRKKAKNDAAE